MSEFDEAAKAQIRMYAKNVDGLSNSFNLLNERIQGLELENKDLRRSISMMQTELASFKQQTVAMINR